MSSYNLTQDNIDTNALYFTIPNGLVSGSQSSTISNGSTSRILCEVSGNHTSSSLDSSLPHPSHSPYPLGSSSSSYPLGSSSSTVSIRSRSRSKTYKALRRRLKRCYLSSSELVKRDRKLLNRLKLQRKQIRRRVSVIEERFRKSLEEICGNVDPESSYHGLLELTNTVSQAIEHTQERIAELLESIEEDNDDSEDSYDDDNHTDVIPVEQTTRYGRTTVPRQFYHAQQFMPGSNNGHTRGRHVDTYCRKSPDDYDDEC